MCCYNYEVMISPTAPHSSSSFFRGSYNRPNSGRCTKWTQSHLTQRTLWSSGITVFALCSGMQTAQYTKLICFPLTLFQPMAKEWHSPVTDHFNTMIYEILSLKKDLTQKGIRSILQYLESKNIFKFLCRSHRELNKPFSHMSSIYVLMITMTVSCLNWQESNDMKI
jgi:hypothetical protein